MTFRLYPPSDAPCAGPPLFTSIKPLTLTGTTATATSDSFTPTVTGVYRWIATYGGDANNEPVSGTCGAAGENVSVALVPPPFPAKLEIARARVLGAARRLDVLAPITKRASGRVNVSFQAAGRTVRFTAPVSATKGWVKIDRAIPAAQARLGTGILRLTYPGDADTQPQDVRLRAAAVHASLDAGRPTITAAGSLQASGRISTRARGVVRLQVLFEPRGEQTRTLSFSARIANGRYSFDAPLEARRARADRDAPRRRALLHAVHRLSGRAHARRDGVLPGARRTGRPARRLRRPACSCCMIARDGFWQGDVRTGGHPWGSDDELPSVTSRSRAPPCSRPACCWPCSRSRRRAPAPPALRSLARRAPVPV